MKKGDKHNKEARSKMSCLSHFGINNRSIEWVIIHPSGQKEIINNLAEFCRIHNLSYDSLRQNGQSKEFCLNMRTIKLSFNSWTKNK
jgi:hypothetical protein